MASSSARTPTTAAGNQGSNWSELDLVPIRLTARIRPAQTFIVVIAADAEEGGSQGFDLISVPQVNPGLSGPTCRAPVVGAQERLDPGIDNIDVTLIRRLTITSAGDETCVYDWYQRLAVGAGFNGSSLHTTLRNENLTSSGVGTQSVSLNPGSVKAAGPVQDHQGCARRRVPLVAQQDQRGLDQLGGHLCRPTRPARSPPRSAGPGRR